MSALVCNADADHDRERGSSRRKTRRGERGYVLMVTALVLVPLMIAVGYATDVGAWYYEGSKMQRAADAAAMAGVVWLPDLAKATEAALAEAATNGFDDLDPNITVTVTVIDTAKLRVTITDTSAPMYFSRPVIDNKTITRHATATFTLPVPMGSPKNYFGTGNLLPAPNSEGFWAAITGWCAPKEQGDPFASMYMGNWESTGALTDIHCPGATPNPEHKTSRHYGYVLTVPANRAQELQLHLYDPHPSTSSPNDTWYTDKVTTSVTIYAPDGTPFNDSDNPLAQCIGSGEENPKTYGPLSLGLPVGEPAAVTLNGSAGWIRDCTISAGAPAGRYLIDVETLEGEAASIGMNSYALFASYNGDGAMCDARTSTLCPQIAARDFMSIKAQSGSPDASFFLADIGSEHAGKRLRLSLFDPGEGGNYIEFLDPNGTPVTFDFHTLDGDYSGTDLTQLDVSGCSGMPQVGTGRASQCKFNERWVIVDIDLPSDYATLYPTDHWWRVHYNFSTVVTDRTTIGVSIGGDPVSLVE